MHYILFESSVLARDCDEQFEDWVEEFYGENAGTAKLKYV